MPRSYRRKNGTPADNMTQALQYAPRPTTKGHIKSLLGLGGFTIVLSRSFVHSFFFDGFNKKNRPRSIKDRNGTSARGQYTTIQDAPRPTTKRQI